MSISWVGLLVCSGIETEDCAYCPQSEGLKEERLVDLELRLTAVS